jgi:hypothetical protein
MCNHAPSPTAWHVEVIIVDPARTLTAKSHVLSIGQNLQPFTGSGKMDSIVNGTKKSFIMDWVVHEKSKFLGTIKSFLSQKKQKKIYEFIEEQ